MRNLTTYFLLLCLLGGASDAAAQFGTLGGTGVGVDGRVASGNSASTAGVTAGYIFSSSFEAGGGLSREEFKNLDLAATQFGPYVAVYPIRESQGYPFSIVMEGGYERVRYEGDRTTDFASGETSVTGNRFRLEVGAFSPLHVTDAFRVLPYLGVSYALRTKADIFQSREELTGLHFRLPLKYGIGKRASVIVAPTAFVGDDDNTRFGGTAALLFSLGDNRGDSR